MRRFSRVSVERACAWIDEATASLAPEDVFLEGAAGRVLGADLRAAEAIPAADCAAIDGFAVSAAASLGAGTYNPLTIAAIAIGAGEPMPPGTDAVVPAEQAEPDGSGHIELIESVASEANVDRRGAVAEAGATLLVAGTCLTPRHLGLAGLAGVTGIAVVRRPRVRLVIGGQPRSGANEGNRLMLHALIARDGGVVIEASLAQAFGSGADIIVLAGSGGEEQLASAVGSAASLDIHGVALIPGETAGFGRTANGTPALVLPAGPVGCLWNYELFARRAIRRLGGREPALPYDRRQVTTARKIVSPIGMTEICPIRRLSDGRVEPSGSFVETGLRAAVAADGFIIVPAQSEGYPAGASVSAYFYRKC
ncbi:MAG: molybdopterin biosynthesis protein [Stellaceae bacterium]